MVAHINDRAEILKALIDKRREDMLNEIEHMRLQKYEKIVKTTEDFRNRLQAAERLQKTIAAKLETQSSVHSDVVKNAEILETKIDQALQLQQVDFEFPAVVLWQYFDKHWCDYDPASQKVVEAFFVGKETVCTLSSGYFSNKKQAYVLERLEDGSLQQRNCTTGYARRIRRSSGQSEEPEEKSNKSKRCMSGVKLQIDATIDRCIDDTLIVQCLRGMRFVKRPPPAVSASASKEDSKEGNNEDGKNMGGWSWLGDGLLKPPTGNILSGSTSAFRTYFGSEVFFYFHL